MARDFDLIAVPWMDDADIPDKLIQSFVRFIIKHTIEQEKKGGKK